MRRIYDKYGSVLYCIRDDGTITDKWDVDIVGHCHEDRITDKYDLSTMFCIRDDGTITDKWDVDIVGHIGEDGTITDKYNIDRYGRVDVPLNNSLDNDQDSSYSSYSYGLGGLPQHGSYFPIDYGPWNSKKTKCLITTILIQGVYIIALITGLISWAINESLGLFLAVNLFLLVNSLISGILCRVAYYRVGSIVSTSVNAIIGVYIFFSALQSIEGFIMKILAFIFFGAVECFVVWCGNLISSAFCKKHY